MKQKRLLIALCALCSILWPFSGWGYTINDTYWGGTVQNAAPTYGDVIGYPEFSINGITVTQNGTLMTVKITGQYFSYYVSNGGGTTVRDFGPGDLYISSHGWHTSGGSAATHFNTDQFTLSEGWDYVISRNGGIYQLSTNIANITMTNLTPLDPNNWIYRENQAFIGGYNGPVGGYTNIPEGTLDSNGITFVFDTKNMHLGSEIGLHWTMRCGNDVVEGGVPVPEPSTILLLGAGILGAGIFVRKREK